MLDPQQRFRLAELARGHEALRLFVLFGSRAREQAREGSDWDFGYIAGGSFDPEALRVALVLSLETDEVDLADLERASGLLRFRAARDAIVLFEAPGAFRDFWQRAVGFWCDIEPVLRRSYDALLGELPRG